MAAASKMEEAKPTGPARPVMYGLLTIQQLFVYLTRFGCPYLVPFLVQVKQQSFFFCCLPCWPLCSHR